MRYPYGMGDAFKKLAIVAGAVLAWGFITSGMEARDAEITAKEERAAHERVITYRLPTGELFHALMPLEYSAASTQCSTKDGCKTRYYNPRQK